MLVLELIEISLEIIHMSEMLQRETLLLFSCIHPLLLSSVPLFMECEGGSKGVLLSSIHLRSHSFPLLTSPSSSLLHSLWICFAQCFCARFSHGFHRIRGDFDRVGETATNDEKLMMRKERNWRVVRKERRKDPNKWRNQHVFTMRAEVARAYLVEFQTFIKRITRRKGRWHWHIVWKIHEPPGNSTPSERSPISQPAASAPATAVSVMMVCSVYSAATFPKRLYLAHLIVLDDLLPILL